MTPDEMREYKRRCVEARKAKEAAFQQTVQDNQARIMAEYQRQHPPKMSITLQRYFSQRRVR